MMHVDLLHPADQLVMIMQRIYSCGMTTTSGGNLSIRDENGDIWITPTGIDKGSLTREGIVRVSPSGETFGPHQPSVELPFHREIYRLRPDLRAILHAHPPTLVAFSLARRIPDIRLTPDVRRICGDVAMAAYDVPGSRQLGVNIARRFAEGYQTVVMENHGCVCGARDLFGAFMAFETLDFCGRMELYARKLGAPRPLTPEQLSRACGAEGLQADALPAAAASSRERALRRDLCGMIHRAYDQRLCTSAQGAFSQRLSGESFLMTPHRKDRRYLDVADLVRVENGRCEAGKTPGGSAPLHQAIYRAHPDVQAVIVAHAPAVMAFAVTGAAFDSRIIPESYIQLRDVRRVPYDALLEDPAAVAALFSARTPVLLVDNACAVVTGPSLLGAFDRLEVLEYSAQAILAARDVGPLVMIDDRQVRDIEEAFHLD